MKDARRYDSRPDVAELHRLFRYDAGRLYWRVARGRSSPGKIAGRIMANGYESVRISGRAHYTHRVVFAMHHERWPVGQLDHINGVRSDNRIENLREATASQNSHASVGISPRNTSGFRGVSKREYGRKWRASIAVDGRFISLGVYSSSIEAARAYNTAALEIYGEFARINPL